MSWPTVVRVALRVMGSGPASGKACRRGEQGHVVSGEGGVRYEVDSAELATLAAAALDLQTIWDSAIADLGATVSPVQLRALLAIHRFGDLSLNALAEQLRASTSATSKLCDRLQQAGMITRSKTTADRRGVVLGLSEAGDRLVRWAQAQHRDRLGSIMAAMSPPVRDVLVLWLNEF